MNDLIIPVLCVAFLVVVAASILRARGGKLGAQVYQRQERLFSAAELRFLSALDQAVLPGQRVFGKVRVADLVSVKAGLSPQATTAARNRIAQKHVDFVICGGPEFLPICAVELNDSSHGSAKAKRRDELLASALDQAGVPLVMVKAAGSYSVESIRQVIAAGIQSVAPGPQRAA